MLVAVFKNLVIGVTHVPDGRFYLTVQGRLLRGRVSLQDAGQNNQYVRMHGRLIGAGGHDVLQSSDPWKAKAKPSPQSSASASGIGGPTLLTSTPQRTAPAAVVADKDEGTTGTDNHWKKGWEDYNQGWQKARKPNRNGKKDFTPWTKIDHKAELANKDSSVLPCITADYYALGYRGILIVDRRQTR
jgi:hypothetical protein